jgi:mRNA-degrading endonuclease RelE of RelBE toxin-antitoxin system
VGLLPGPSSGIIARAPREVVLLDRAQRDLLGIQAVERRMLATIIDRLAMDALPHGVEAVEGRFRDHLRLRVGRFRLLYKVSEATLTVVAALGS